LYVILNCYQPQHKGRVTQTEKLSIPFGSSDKIPVSMQIVNGSLPVQRIHLKL